MTGRKRTRASSPTTNAARLALAGVAVSLGALALAGQANADPADPGTPPAPGQPVVEAAGPPPAPGDAPPNFNPSAAVGRIPDDQAHYGSGSGPLGFLRDAWHQAQDPYGVNDPSAGMGAAPPPGAGPAPALPPGYVSTNAPGSETVMPAGPPPPHPALPPGYYSKNGPPPPPEYFDAPPPAPPGPAPGAYVPVHSPPPPPLLPPA
jgi:hypothetical protein